MKGDPVSLAQLLKTGRLGSLTREAERRREATAEVKALLPAEEASHLVSAVTNEQGDLVLVMDTPTWAARVRYSVAGLANPKVKIRVLPRRG